MPPRAGTWPTALALSLAATWHAATPGPTFDGWHGLGWRAMLDPSAPRPIRLVLLIAAISLVGVIAVNLAANRLDLIGRARSRRVLGLIVVGSVLAAARQIDLPGVEPVGYWPRWAFVWGMLAWLMSLIRVMPTLPRGGRGVGALGVGAGAVAGLIALGLTVIWYHRPLERFKAIAPGRLYISAMPTYRGLEVAHARHRFKTIINLFPERTAQRSPILPDELRFVREHGINYVESPGRAREADAFLDRTLALARDPEAWPILVHCHGCMDRTPAWTGIYRFVVQGRPLIDILREIEQHRGDRPKATVTLLYNRVLAPRAAGRYDLDPTAPVLRANARGEVDRIEQARGGRSKSGPDSAL